MTPLEEAIAEAYASAPDTGIILDAMEINHQDFTQPFRGVNWPVTGPDPERFMLRHEPEAALDPDQVVEYLGLPFQILPPESSNRNPGTFQIKVALHADFDKYLEAAVTHPGIIKATYRQYIKGRESEGPAVVWDDLTITSPRREGGNIIADAAVLTWAFKLFGKIYRSSDYPALTPGR